MSPLFKKLNLREHSVVHVRFVLGAPRGAFWLTAQHASSTSPLCCNKAILASNISPKRTAAPPPNSSVRPDMPYTRPSHITAYLLAITSAASLGVMTLIVIVAGVLTPGYSHVSQFISELGATGAPQEGLVRFAGFLPAGLLLLAFCVLGLCVLPRSPALVAGLLGLAVYAMGYLVAAGFPCDLGCHSAEPSTSQLIHNAGGLVGYLLAPIFLFALSRAARAWSNAFVLVVAGYIASGAALIGLLTLSPSSAVVGLSQRLLEVAVLGWVALCGLYVARQSPGGVQVCSRRTGAPPLGSSVGRL